MSTDLVITEAEKQKIRSQNFEDSKFDFKKQKYGLFSFTGTLAISPNSYDRIVRARRNSEGAVMTEPKNFLTSPSKRGKNNDTLFSFPGYASLGDRYKDPTSRFLDEKTRAEKMAKNHEVRFKPPGHVDMEPIYEHLPADKTKIKRRRDSEGNVIFEPKNFYTSPSKKGHPNTTPGTSFRNIEYISDPYDRKRDLTRKERQENKAKMHEKPFKPTINNTYPFNNDEQVFHVDESIKKILKKPKPEKVAQHDAPFKPTSPLKSHLVDCLFMKLPEYIPDPLPTVSRKSPNPGIP